ncbi:Mur ligase middle domain protein [Gemmatirosa kalamazoonensis]|uniref:Mur ligase middle domain protein n=1 Tax=Gemmatirosa kalamazoonensis TaxID=861299 RepID=W0RM66_9BACT|nr:Mur ligase family protein [Gemmatirosa kalamazoonensis]AHG91557.1 Mur ligase middle domain protein [Gemmatirosa kalamazoonensis]
MSTTTTPAPNGNVLETIDGASVRRIHLLGVAGTGMGAFAGMLKAAGYDVTGSDTNVYPPMSDMLRAWEIDVMTPYDPANLDRARPDLVIVGNVIRRENPEATAVRERGLPSMSFPAAFGSLILATRHSVVVAGTHGKTTTSALMAHVLAAAGLDPTFLVGGVTRNYDSNFRLGKGPHAVVEGDEYDTAYFDKGPKFMHYRARTAILTSLEFDHADIYRDLPHYESAFERFAAVVPPEGQLIVSAQYPRLVAIARAHGEAPVVTYAAAPHEVPDTRFQAVDVRLGPDGARFRVRDAERGSTSPEYHLPMAGYHNVENAVGVYVAARALGLTDEQIAPGFATFAGVKRRQEPRGEIGGVLVLDDFAHHPTAVRETVAAVRARYPDRRLLAVFEPRSNTSRRNLHQAEYGEAFEGAQHVFLREPEPHDKVPVDQRLDAHAVVRALEAHGIEAEVHEPVPTLVQCVADTAAPGDVVLVMSNGAFGGFIPSLLDALASRAARRAQDAPNG